MTTAPIVEKRSSNRPYLAIHTKVKMQDIPSVLPPLIFEVTDWLKENNIPADGIAFFHYKSMNEDCSELDTAVGILTPASATGNDRITTGAFPAGNYATLIYIGDYKNMKEGHMALDGWIKQNNLKEKHTRSASGVEWGGRTEFYLSEPGSNPEECRTEVAFLLED
ncbi:MAG: GyrI-like domain-containing protein [Ferruginibacter sp.]